MGMLAVTLLFGLGGRQGMQLFSAPVYHYRTGGKIHSSGSQCSAHCNDVFLVAPPQNIENMRGSREP